MKKEYKKPIIESVTIEEGAVICATSVTTGDEPAGGNPGFAM